MAADYSKQWREYRRRHWSACLGLVVGLPAMVVLAIFLKVQWHISSQAVFPVLTCIWASAWAWAAFRLVRFPCPQCGHAFQSARVCEHCGLWLYEQAQPSAQADGPASGGPAA